MHNRRNLLLIFLVLVLSFLLFTSSGFADEVAPTSTIGSIDGPADVGTTTIPTETTIFVEECINIGDPYIGQTEYGLAPCELTQTTTTQVATDDPPIPGVAQQLPSTGNVSSAYIIFGFALIGLGFGLLRIRRHL